ncbi:UNVERIFIED_CONTAM: hypothetical protein GTU68_055163, partial [Idotea baltica]|nr:hypothetical protein [Idotea baltica]
GVIHGVDVDTNHFTGNHPSACSIEACFSPDGNLELATWAEILPTSSLNPGSQHLFEIQSREQWTHVKLHIYPDGGVARLKVYGEVKKDWSVIDETALVNLAAATNGAKSIACNDMYFSHMDNLLMPGRGVNMGDGWETKRNRTPNNRDWVIIRLAHPGVISQAVIDTAHFKGNYPESCSIEGCSVKDDNIEDAEWKLVLPKYQLEADNEHDCEKEICEHEAVSHVRLSIFPDGGISRLRLFGTIKK